MASVVMDAVGYTQAGKMDISNDLDALLTDVLATTKLEDPFIPDSNMNIMDDFIFPFDNVMPGAADFDTRPNQTLNMPSNMAHMSDFFSGTTPGAPSSVSSAMDTSGLGDFGFRGPPCRAQSEPAYMHDDALMNEGMLDPLALNSWDHARADPMMHMPQDNKPWNEATPTSMLPSAPVSSRPRSSSLSSKRRKEPTKFRVARTLSNGGDEPTGAEKNTNKDTPFRRTQSLGASSQVARLNATVKRRPQSRSKKEKTGNCACCDCSTTPLWREGRNGVRLCNACGIRWVKYGIACETCNYVPRKHEAKNINCPRCPGNFLPPEPLALRRRSKSTSGGGSAQNTAAALSMRMPSAGAHAPPPMRSQSATVESDEADMHFFPPFQPMRSQSATMDGEMDLDVVPPLKTSPGLMGGHREPPTMSIPGAFSSSNAMGGPVFRSQSSAF